MSLVAWRLMNRRHFFRLGFAGGLAFSLPALSTKAALLRGAERPKSLITLWLGGGPSQLETWDPHPGTAIGGPTRAIDTKIPGVHIAHHYPRTAQVLDNVCVIRSLVSKEGDHERGAYMLKTGYQPDPTLVHPSLGAIVAHELPVAGVEIPRHFAIAPGGFAPRGGFLGDEYDAFKLYDPRNRLQNMVPQVSETRQLRRVANMSVIESAFRARHPDAAERTQHELTVRKALTMMTSKQLRAFDVTEEPAALREAYGESPFGRGCLVARRLVEEGVRAIEVTLEGFDSHAKNFEAHENRAKVLDPALATLLADLRQRDLLDSTVVLCLGEFGRTPKINPLDGRDHWPTGFSVLVAGAGFRRGVVVGETDPAGKATAPADGIEIKNFFATILHTLGVDYAKEMQTPIGRPMKLSAGAPVAKLLTEV